MDAARFVGTEPLPADGRIAPERLQAYLSERLPDCRGAMTIERFRGGQSNPTMVLAFDGERRVVLRKKPDGKLLPSAHAVDREFRVTSALAGTDVPVARPRLFCDDATIVGTVFYVMDYVPGRTFWEPWLPGLTPAERRTLYGDLCRIVSTLHRLDFGALGLADFGRPLDYVSRQVARWTMQYRASETERIEAMEALIAWLPGNVPPQRRAALIHGDYRLDNVIVHATEPRVVAVVDWELSTIGDPLADFAYHALAWIFPQVPYRGLAGTDLDALGIPDLRRNRDAYLTASGEDDLSDRHWYTYLAFCLFRVAAIRQGITKRVVDGTASNPHAREAGALARAVAEMGLDCANKAMNA